MSSATAFDLAGGLEILERAPAVFRALLGGLSDAWLHADEGPDTFSAFENLALLRGSQLGPRELALEGVHPALGTVTLAQLLATWVAHDLSHLAQTARVMAKRHRELVGPWREYLPIMDR